MKLATLISKNPKNRNGELAVVSKDGTQAVRVQPETSLLTALENWSTVAPLLEKIYLELNAGKRSDSFALNFNECLAPLPNSRGFYDGSAFLSHVVRARKARGDQMPESAKLTPLMYQGVSDNLLPWNAPLDIMKPEYGGDFEGELAVITTDVPKGTPKEKLGPYMVLFTLFNDITYREIVKTEIETKFGFLQSKPNSSFAPLVVTPNELGSHWDGRRVHLDVLIELNKKKFGNPNGREMHFTFAELVAHAGRTRPLSAGTIVGTGTISNESVDRGFACLVEKRYQEVIETGKATTPWLQVGDHVHMDVFLDGKSVFGPIDQKVTIG